jgi:hypothetical protein
MNFIRCLSLICFALLLSGTAKNNYVRHADESFHYSIYLPSDWKKSGKILENKHTITLTRGGNADITVSATRLDDEERIKWETWNVWYLKGFGSRLLKIIATKELSVGNNILCKILVFEYTHREGSFLQRAMLFKYADNLLLIECRAPVRNFSRYTDLFNTVMASVKFFEPADTGIEHETVREDKSVPEPDINTIIELELKIIEKLEKLGIIEKIE